MASIWGSFVDLRQDLEGCDQFSKGVYGSHYQRILFGSKYHENTIRFMIKALIGKIMYDQNISFISEWQYHRDRKVFDTLPLVDLKDNVIYRFNEAKVQIKHKNFNEKLIKVPQLKSNLSIINDLEKELKEWLGYERKVQK